MWSMKVLWIFTVKVCLTCGQDVGQKRKFDNILENFGFTGTNSANNKNAGPGNSPVSGQNPSEIEKRTNAAKSRTKSSPLFSRVTGSKGDSRGLVNKRDDSALAALIKVAGIPNSIPETAIPISRLRKNNNIAKETKVITTVQPFQSRLVKSRKNFTRKNGESGSKQTLGPDLRKPVNNKRLISRERNRNKQRKHVVKLDDPLKVNKKQSDIAIRPTPAINKFFIPNSIKAASSSPASTLSVKVDNFESRSPTLTAANVFDKTLLEFSPRLLLQGKNTHKSQARNDIHVTGRGIPVVKERFSPSRNDKNIANGVNTSDLQSSLKSRQSATKKINFRTNAKDKLQNIIGNKKNIANHIANPFVHNDNFSKTENSRNIVEISINQPPQKKVSTIIGDRINVENLQGAKNAALGRLKAFAEGKTPSTIVNKGRGRARGQNPGNENLVDSVSSVGGNTNTNTQNQVSENFRSFNSFSIPKPQLKTPINVQQNRTQNVKQSDKLISNTGDRRIELPRKKTSDSGRKGTNQMEKTDKGRLANKKSKKIQDRKEHEKTEKEVGPIQVLGKCSFICETLIFEVYILLGGHGCKC